MAQLARATGSYPVGRKFKSYCRHHIRPVGQEVKTTPFHGVIMSSILVRVTKSEHFTVFGFFYIIKNIQAVSTPKPTAFFHNIRIEMIVRGEQTGFSDIKQSVSLPGNSIRK